VPFHFNKHGKNSIGLGINSFVFFKPLVIHIKKMDKELVNVKDLIPHRNAIEYCDILFIKTDWGNLRSSQPERYASVGPGLSSAAVRFLVDEFPSLKALGLDLISLGSAANIEETIKAHKAVTGSGKENGKYIIVIEDMIIDDELNSAKRIYTWPLFIEGADASPVTVVAEF
jgi:kynurenine formamidase